MAIVSRKVGGLGGAVSASLVSSSPPTSNAPRAMSGGSSLVSEIIGKLGGAEVKSFPVEVTMQGATGSEEILAEIEIPENETWLVSVEGDLAVRFGASSSTPEIYLGDQKSNGYVGTGVFSIAGAFSGDISLRMVRKNGTGVDSFSGTVYTVKI